METTGGKESFLAGMGPCLGLQRLEAVVLGAAFSSETLEFILVDAAMVASCRNLWKGCLHHFSVSPIRSQFREPADRTRVSFYCVFFAMAALSSFGRMLVCVLSHMTSVYLFERCQNSRQVRCTIPPSQEHRHDVVYVRPIRVLRVRVQLTY